MRIRRLAGGALAVATLVAGMAATSTTAGAAKKAPQVKIVLLAETKGDSSAAVPYYADGATMAAEELGDKVSVTRIPAPLTPAAAQTALLQALDQKPDLIIGFPSSAQVIAVQPTIEQSGVPVIALASGEQTVADGPYGAPNLYLVRPVDTINAAVQTNYALDTLKAKKIGLECVDSSTGVNGCNAAKKVIAGKKGVTVVAERTNTTSATDLTEQARAMQGSDVVLDFNFPNPTGVMANQLVANGVDAVHMAGASAGLQAAAGVVKDEAATNLLGVDDCVPIAQKDAQSKKFVAAYKAKFGDNPIYSAAQTYDMIKFAAQIAATQGAVTPKAILKGLSSQSYDGVCTDYKGDSIHALSHTLEVVKFDAGGAPSIKKTLSFEPGQLAFTVVTTAPATTTPAPTSTKAP
jgi:branched-chain amino acid transport system substrate-binding protein